MPAPGRPLRPGRVRLAVACVLASAVAVWWIAGDISYPVVGYARLVHRRSMPAALEHGIGGVALCTAAIALVLLISNEEEKERERRWRPVFLVFLLVGAPMFGYGYRVLTARDLGGNIGAGLFLILGLPTGGVTLLWATLRAVNLARLTVPDSSDPSS